MVTFRGAGRIDLDRLRRERAANDEALRDTESAQKIALRDAYRGIAAQLLLREARGTFCVQVLVPGPLGQVRKHLFDVVRDEPRLLVVGGRASGKTALVSLLVDQAAGRRMGFGPCVPLMVPVERMNEGELDEEEIGRLNPALGAHGVRHALEAGHGLLVVDGLDESGAPDALKTSIGLLQKAYPKARMVVTTRPLRRKIPGRSESTIEGFVTVHIAPPEAQSSPVLHDLSEERSEQRRIQRVEERLGDLLLRWSPSRLPKGARLAQLTHQGRLLLASRIATIKHYEPQVEMVEADLEEALSGEVENARWFAETEQLLHEDEHPQGGVPFEEAGAFGREALEEIRAYPGVIEERRPGVFSFCDLATQQYLTAMYFTKEDDAYHFLAVRDDPWWHEVIVFASGLGAPYSSILPGRKIVALLLAASASADSATTFLAARCAAVTAYLPAALRSEIDRRLQGAVPPRSNWQLAHFVDDVGEIAAPWLVAALAKADANERAYLVTILGRLDYPPAVRAILRLLGDAERVTDQILCWAWKADVIATDVPVGFYAFSAYFNLALWNPAAYRSFDDAIAKATPLALQVFVGMIVHKMLQDEYWGAAISPERDPDRVSTLLEKVLLAVTARDMR